MVYESKGLLAVCDNKHVKAKISLHSLLSNTMLFEFHTEADHICANDTQLIAAVSFEPSNEYEKKKEGHQLTNIYG